MIYSSGIIKAAGNWLLAAGCLQIKPAIEFEYLMPLKIEFDL